MLNAGTLRERIVLQRAEHVGRGADGSVITEFRTYATVRAQVIQQRSSKAFSNGENWYPTARSFKLRIPPEVKGGDRVLYRGETYVALPPKVFERQGYQEIDCELCDE
ncbi:MAG: head-tail adaptor protein [Bacteroidaceae bacterium]|nr:head-tail adaptor protein [Bacteroidaceae bacterium]